MHTWATTWHNQQNECAHSEDSDQTGRIAKDPSFFHADSEDSDQTGRMPRLIWLFAVRTLILLVLSCGGSLKSFMSWVKREDNTRDVQYVMQIAI